jgi:hypothetical protein
MRLTRKYWALETVLKLYKEEKISLVDGVKLIRVIIGDGIGLKDARDFIERASSVYLTVPIRESLPLMVFGSPVGDDNLLCQTKLLEAGGLGKPK